MMHQVPQAGLTALAVAGPVERVVRPHWAVAGTLPTVLKLGPVEALRHQRGNAARQSVCRVEKTAID